MNGWFPRINARGEVLSGDTEVWLTKDNASVRLVTNGGGPVWVTPDTFIFNDRVSKQVMWPSGDTFHGYNTIASDEQGRWAGYLATGPGYVDLYENATFIRRIDAAGTPKFGGGKFGYLTPVQSETHTLMVNDVPVYTGAIVDYILTASEAIVMVATGTYTRQYIGIPTVHRSEGGPIESDGWLLSNAGDAEGLLVRPLRSTQGYFLPGEWQFPDFKKFGDTLVVVGSSRGELKMARLSVNDLRQDLPSLYTQAVPTPPTPVPTPPPAPKEPVPVMPIAPNKLSVVQAVMAAHPEINRLSDGPFAPNRGGITQLVVQALGGYPWGRKSRDGSPTNLSDDALCFRVSADSFEIYDIISGGDGSAGFDYKGTFKDGENGFFYTVAMTPGQPTPGPAPVSDTSVDAAVKALVAFAQAPLLARLSALEAKLAALNVPAPAPTLSLDGQRIALKTDNGHYLCAEGGGGQVVNATRDAAGGWETFTIETK